MTAIKTGRKRLTAAPARHRQPVLLEPRPASGLTTEILRAQEAERSRLARELHDEIGQTLTALKINLQIVGSGALGPGLEDRVSESLELVDRTLSQIRRLSLDLHPLLLDACGLEAAIRCHLENLAARTALRVRFSASYLKDRLTADVETACFRIVQEALTNVVRHSQATRVSVRLRRFRHCLTFRIADNGVGFDVRLASQPSRCASSFGLTAMRERAQLARGRLSIVSGRGHGTRISGSLPLI